MICCGCDADLSCAACGCEMPENMGIEVLDVATKWKRRHDELLKALEQIADMDPKGIRADDLGRAARVRARRHNRRCGTSNARPVLTDDVSAAKVSE